MSSESTSESSTSGSSTDSLSLPSGGSASQSRSRSPSPSATAAAAASGLPLPPRATPPISPQATFGGRSPEQPIMGLPSPAMPPSASPPAPPSQLPAASTTAFTSGASAGASGSAPSADKGYGAVYGSQPNRGSFGPPSASFSAAMAGHGSRERPISPASQDSENSYGNSAYSQRSSWIASASPSASQAAIGLARRFRLSSNPPPLPEKPHIPPTISPGARAASSSTSKAGQQQHGGRPSTSAVGGAGPASSSSSSLQPPSAVYSPHAPQSPASSLFSRRSRASMARARARAHTPDEPLPSPLGAQSFASTTFPSMSPRATPTEFTTGRDLPPLPGELPLPHYSFLDEDPSLGHLDSPSFGGPVSHFSGSARRVSAQSAPAEPARPKHLSTQSAYSEYSVNTSLPSASLPGPSDQALSDVVSAAQRSPSIAGSRHSRWSQFAGGAPVAWGLRDSRRASLKSAKSFLSQRSKKRSSKHASIVSTRGEPSDVGHEEDVDWAKDDETADILVLVRRAAVLERLLRAGKRASGMTNNKRMSGFSASSRYSRSSRPADTQSHSRSNNGAQRSDSQRRSTNSISSSSIAHRLANRLGLIPPTHRFDALSSDDGFDEKDGNFIDLASTDHTSSSSHHMPPPGTPPRRAISTSFTRNRAPTPPGQGAGIIVFPELSTMPPPDPIRHNGDVCAQSCLPASVAIPYTALAPPPPTQKIHTSRNLHSLRNLRFIDEKHIYKGVSFSHWHSADPPPGRPTLWGDVPNCDDRISPSARRLRIAIIVTCALGIMLIVGLLAGLLSRRYR